MEIRLYFHDSIHGRQPVGVRVVKDRRHVVIDSLSRLSPGPGNRIPPPDYGGRVQLDRNIGQGRRLTLRINAK